MFDGEPRECSVTIDRNGEYLCETGSVEDGSYRFAKFHSEADMDEAVARHNEVNAEVPEVIPEVAYGEVTTFDKDGNEVK